MRLRTIRYSLTSNRYVDKALQEVYGVGMVSGY